MDLRRAQAANKVSVTITSALVSACLEWVLMFMIFVHACFSYLITTFARHFQLQIPCLLCSRLDHVLANQKPGYHLDLFCRNHKLNISSLVLCQIHDNLVDVRGMCETCLFSFATINKSNAETYRLLVGKLGAEPHYGASSDSRKCTCCNEEWVSKTSSGNLFQSELIGSEVTEHDAPPSITLKFTGDEMQGIIERSMPNKNADLLPHVEYKQIKVYSDTESESPSSDTESVNPLIHEMEASVQDSAAKNVQSGPQIIADADFPALEELVRPDPPIKSSLSECDIVESETPLGHGLEELNWQQAPYNKDVSEPSELISFTEELPSNGIHDDASRETNATSTLDATSTTRLEEENHDECGEVSHRGIDSAGTDELWKEVTTECGEISRAENDSATVNETQMNTKSSMTGTSSQMAESFDLGDAYRLALGTRSRQLSGKLLEQQRSMNELTRVSEDFKLLLSQISARGTELSLNDISPRVSANTEDFKAIDAYDAIGMQMTQRRISLERNESNLSLDGTTVSEIEGESAVDRLRRQVEHDKKIMGTLYKELEEERNASAVAVNQAMAMITRLQEEKAQLHMEALQCLRMMEEQAEYDGEALQNANDLLTEKEKHIQDIEFELESYRNQLGELNAHKLETNDNNSDNDKNDIDTRRISLGLEDEKQYILECLKKLEVKLLNFAKLEPNPRMIDGALSTEEVPEASASDRVDWMGVSQENGGTERNHLQGYELTAKEPPKDLSGHAQREIHHFSADAKLEALRHELSMMKNRLEALEAEQKLIDCSINSLGKGSEGLEFIREIAVPLQELHSALIKTRHENLTRPSVFQS